MRLNAGLACLFVCSLGGVAWAQLPPPADTPIPTDPAPPPPPPPPPTTTTTTTTTAPPQQVAAHDDDAPLGSAIGVGVHAMLGGFSAGGGTTISGPVGPAIVY